MLDKLLAAFSLGCLMAFMAIVIYYIAEPDLTIVTVAVLLMAAYDFFRLNTTDKPGPPPGNDAAR
jgi:hypothetical protein